MSGCACFHPNDLCTRLGYLGLRLHAMADSDTEDTSDKEDYVIWAVSYMSLVEAEIKMESTINIIFKS